MGCHCKLSSSFMTNTHTYRFGPGAGAASAGLLAVMPISKSMVRRVIAISGSPLADWAVINDKFRAMNTSRVYGERVGCTIGKLNSQCAVGFFNKTKNTMRSVNFFG